MSLPSFDQFISDLDEEQIVKKINALNKMNLISVDDIRDPKNLESLIPMLMQRSAALGTKVSLIYLEEYHRWLSEQL